MGVIFSYFFPPVRTDYNNYNLLEMYKPITDTPPYKINNKSHNSNHLL
jgi:hypothetical protein